MTTINSQRPDDSVPLHLVNSKQLEPWLSEQSSRAQEWLRANAFTGREGSLCAIPSEDGGIAAVAVGVGEDLTTWSLSPAAASLPPANYHLAAEFDELPPDRHHIVDCAGHVSSSPSGSQWCGQGEPAAIEIVGPPQRSP